MFRKTLAAIILLLFLANPLRADWKSKVGDLLDEGFSDIASASCLAMNPDPLLVKKVLPLVPDWQDLQQLLINREFKNTDKRGKLSLHKLVGIDGKARPWVLYVPENYWHKRRTPMLVALHGGVSRTSVSEDPVGWAKDSEWLELAKSKGWFALFPFGEEGATWWDAVGMTNIRRQIQLTKHHFNIDDDRVYLVGFSDGASAGFLHAMLRPDDFAAIVALNGHMGVGSLDGGLSTYAPNMANTPIYAATTDNDALYPTSTMAATINMAIQSGANILYRQLAGEHEFSYARKELPLIGDFLDNHPRCKFPTRVFWETSSLEFGRCRWLAIDQVRACAAENWHRDFNLEMVSDRVTIGFMPKRVKGGVGVEKVIENTFAMQAGLKEGDLIVEAAGKKIRGNYDLDKVKAMVKRGDPLAIKVLRASETIELRGVLPAAELYFLFKREAPSAAVKAECFGNNIRINGSRLGKIRLLVSSAQFNLEKPIEVTCMGKSVWKKIVEPDAEFMFLDFLRNRDRKMLPVSFISLDFSE